MRPPGMPMPDTPYLLNLSESCSNDRTPGRRFNLSSCIAHNVPCRIHVMRDLGKPLRVIRHVQLTRHGTG